MSRLQFAVAISIAFGLLSTGVLAADVDPISFESDIQPLLAEKCGKCHSSTVQKGGLDLSSFASLMIGGESGDPAIADSIDDSPLWTMIEGGEMPPDGHPQLTEAEKIRIHQWIIDGAPSTMVADTAKAITDHEVMPIVLLRCTMCHGARRQDGGLDLRSADSMLRGGTNGPAFVAGDPEASLMIQRIETEACPPRDLLLRFFVKRPSAGELQTLRDWIAGGAVQSDIVADVATTQPDPLVTDEDRRHWAFQTPRQENDGGSIDAFLSTKLQEHGLMFSPPADRDTLIRRAHFALHGLPPSVSQWRRWRDDSDPNWYSKMIDWLLASPRYGEHWGQYWLDLAGYADSEGGVSNDPVRKVAWKYRDYVIRSFNEDKPYDRFLIEQIAGDELTDYQNEPVVTDQMVDQLVATGFLRMGIDQTGSRTMNFVPERLDVIADAITVVSEGLMGLTVGCAKCHSHKYDPIPQRDYYRLKAIFQGAMDEHDWLTFQNRNLEVGTPEHRQRFAEVNPPLAAELKRLQGLLNDAIANVRLERLRHHYPEQSEAERNETLRALRIADNVRSQPQRLLVEKLQRVEILPDADQPDSVLEAIEAVNSIEQTIREVQRQMEPPLTIRALWDRGEPSPTYLLRRGEHDKPGPLVGPGVPSVLTDGKTPFLVEPPFPGGTPKTGRRLAFARWLVDKDHPLTSRVMVNRLWYHHFGAGIVPTLENFGVKGEPASHGELLDWLAVEFVRRGWSIKQMHRLIMNTQAYQQTSRIGEQQQRLDPQNRLVSRMTMRRMSGEVLRDTLLATAGRLDETPGGPPDPVTVDADGLVSVFPRGDLRWRRSVYVLHRRTEIPSLLETFDYPQMGPNCLARNVSTVAPQSLMLMNNGHVYDLAKAFAQRITDEMRYEDFRSQVEATYHLALNRNPSDDELRLGIAALHQLEQDLPGQPTIALQAYCHAIFNSAAFIYID